MLKKESHSILVVKTFIFHCKMAIFNMDMSNHAFQYLIKFSEITIKDTLVKKFCMNVL